MRARAHPPAIIVGMDPDTVTLPQEPDVTAPDGMEVRVLVRTERGSMAHFLLAAGETAVAVRHREVEEVWFTLSGHGEMWRDGRADAVTPLGPGVAIRILPGIAFQLRSLGPGPFAAVAVTMPPWPLDRVEAVPVDGPWAPTVSPGP